MEARKHWLIQVSKTTGKQYWFNTKTGASTYSKPEELRHERDSVPPPPVLPSHGAVAFPPALVDAPLMISPSTALGGFSGARGARPEGGHSGNYRDTVESVCRGLAAAAGAAGDPPPTGSALHMWRLALQRRFPARDSMLCAVVHGKAEEFGLESYAGVDSDGSKFVVVFAPSAPPDEVMQARAAEKEAALVAEAKERQRAEAEVVAAAVAAARERAPLAAVKRRRAGGAQKVDQMPGAGGGAAATAAADAEAVSGKKNKKVRMQLKAEMTSEGVKTDCKLQEGGNACSIDPAEHLLRSLPPLSIYTRSWSTIG